MKSPLVLKGLIALFVYCFFAGSLLAKSILWQGTPVVPSEQPLSGVLTININDKLITGNIGGLSATGAFDEQKHFTLTFKKKDTNKLHAGTGVFRGYMTRESELRGHWVRYGMKKRAWTPYANSVHFSQSNNTYQGVVSPLKDELSIFFKGELKETGRYELNVFVPENNAGRFYANTELVLANGKAKVVRMSEDGEEALATGTYDPTSESFRLFIPSWGGDIHFNKQTDDPRGLLGKKGHQTYNTPKKSDDGWPIGAAEDFGIDPKVLQGFANMLNTTAAQHPFEAQTEAFLLARNGVLIFERYFRGYKPNQPHDLRSASKSLTAILPGLVEQATLLDEPVKSPSILNSKIYDLLDMDTDNLKKRDITLEHVLSMRTGLACNDFKNDSPGNEDTMQEQQDQPDWFRYTLQLDLIHNPGDYSAYCSGGINLAGAVLTAKTKRWIPALIEDLFARPLGIKHYHVNLLPDGQQAYSGGGLYLQARDFLKLGQLMLNKGRWHNQQLLATSYVENVLTPRGSISTDQYGLGWWMRTYELEDRSYEVFYAGGNGGQQIIAVPELDMVAVFLGSAYGTRGSFKLRDDWFPNIILRKAIVKHKL